LIFLFDTVRIWEISPVWADFDKCHNLSKRNVKLILKILSDLEPLRSSSNKKKTLYSSRSCVNWAFFGTSGPLRRSFYSRSKLAHSCQKKGPIYTKTSLIQCFFFFDEPLKGSKSLKIFKINLTFRSDKLWHLSKSAHTGEISQILIVSNKKRRFSKLIIHRINCLP
jgi:hypothetical protein